MGGESCTVLRLKMMRKLAMSLTELINELITELFVEQPLASPGSAKNMGVLVRKMAWISLGVGKVKLAI